MTWKKGTVYFIVMAVIVPTLAIAFMIYDQHQWQNQRRIEIKRLLQETKELEARLEQMRQNGQFDLFRHPGDSGATQTNEDRRQEEYIQPPDYLTPMIPVVTQQVMTP